MSIEIMHCNKSRKSLSQQLLFEVYLFRFHLAPALEYLHNNYNEYPVKRTASLHLELCKSAFLKCVFVIFGKLSLCLF